MVGRKNEKLNQLRHALPEGLLVDNAWLDARGYRRQWREKYVASGWLEGVTRGVYRRPSPLPATGPFPWQLLVVSLQGPLSLDVHVGGRTALELAGLGHYVRVGGAHEVHLYAGGSLPGWIQRVNVDARVVEHRATRLFSSDADTLTSMPWGHWGWSLCVSTPERALLEVLDELPAPETFEQADVLMEAATSLSPRRVQSLLERCRSVKVKRLFLWFAELHQHAWLRRLDLRRIDLGSGKRQIAVGGRLDAKYQITVPEDLRAEG